MTTSNCIYFLSLYRREENNLNYGIFVRSFCLNNFHFLWSFSQMFANCKKTLQITAGFLSRIIVSFSSLLLLYFAIFWKSNFLYRLFCINLYNIIIYLSNIPRAATCLFYVQRDRQHTPFNYAMLSSVSEL